MTGSKASRQLSSHGREAIAVSLKGVDGLAQSLIEVHDLLAGVPCHAIGQPDLWNEHAQICLSSLSQV